MPLKYHIKPSPSPNRFPNITKSGIIAWEEGCLKCARCVKKDCVYDVYKKRGLDTRQMLDSIDSICKDCFRCVQNCPNRLIQKGLNPQYKALGDKYWTSEIITSLWAQAEKGSVPVSGGGYGGTYSGPGFDSMWTDMSEIVRPTRDGIHGREYISTTVDLGRKLVALEFDSKGMLSSAPPPLVELPMPVIFDMLRWSPPDKNINLAFLEAAKLVATFAVIKQKSITKDLEKYLSNIILHIDDPDKLDKKLIKKVSIVEVPYSKNAIDIQNNIKKINEDIVVFIRMQLSKDASGRAAQLVRDGAEVLHLVADEFGMEEGDNPLFIKDRMKQIHLHLVESGLRDQITLIGSGGMALAEHMAKIIICGADAMTIDIPLLAAMECRVCRRCKEGIECPVGLESVDPLWAAGRIKNLMAAWHSQLLEIMGAMGIREVRRLRGEMGRSMFFEDMEKEIFSSLGKRG